MPMNWHEPPLHMEGEGPHDDPIYQCEKCGDDVSELIDVCVHELSFSGPAEYERWCGACVGPDMDESDREPTEDELEARRRR